jgi:hypothetical protein
MTSWSFEEAKEFYLSLHQFIFPLGFDLALAGGVLFRGESDKDLDVIIYPLKKISADYDNLIQQLPNFGLKFVRLPNKNLGYLDDGKNVQVWEFNGKRVDLFFLS